MKKNYGKGLNKMKYNIENDATYIKLQKDYCDLSLENSKKYTTIQNLQAELKEKNKIIEQLIHEVKV